MVDTRAVRRRSMGVHVESISVYRADRVAASLMAHGGHLEVVVIESNQLLLNFCFVFVEESLECWTKKKLHFLSMRRKMNPPRNRVEVRSRLAFFQQEARLDFALKKEDRFGGGLTFAVKLLLEVRWE